MPCSKGTDMLGDLALRSSLDTLKISSPLLYDKVEPSPVLCDDLEMWDGGRWRKAQEGRYADVHCCVGETHNIVKQLSL